MELYIIRHGETEWNKEQRLQGRSDIPLNEYGRELANITSEALKDVEFDLIYSSPLCRAYETALILRRDRNIPIVKDEHLVEMSFGDYEGVPAREVPTDFRAFFDDPVHYTTPPNGESYAHIIKRTSEFIDTVIVPASSQYKRVLIVAHGALNKGLMLHLDHKELKDYWSGVFQRNCCVNIYEVNGTEFTCLQNGRIYYESTQTSFYGKEQA